MYVHVCMYIIMQFHNYITPVKPEKIFIFIKLTVCKCQICHSYSCPHLSQTFSSDLYFWFYGCHTNLKKKSFSKVAVNRNQIERGGDGGGGWSHFQRRYCTNIFTMFSCPGYLTACVVHHPPPPPPPKEVHVLP